jgi:hypothetical protein
MFFVSNFQRHSGEKLQKAAQFDITVKIIGRMFNFIAHLKVSDYAWRTEHEL